MSEGDLVPASEVILTQTFQQYLCKPCYLAAVLLAGHTKDLL